MNGFLLKKILIWSVIVFFFLAAISYGIFSARFLIEGPTILIEYPNDAAILEQNFVEISGQIKNSKELTINGRVVLIDTEGNWREKFLLYPNLNTFTFTATDKFRRSKTKNFNLIYSSKTNTDNQNQAPATTSLDGESLESLQSGL